MPLRSSWRFLVERRTLLHSSPPPKTREMVISDKDCDVMSNGSGGEHVTHDVKVANEIYSDEESGNMLDRDYTGVFEGPEKTLEVVFRKEQKVNSFGDQSEENMDRRTLGLRRLSRSDLDRICSRARCDIVSSISNDYLDAYVLSESSLFIYPYMLVLKTCGTTTLLRCIGTLVDLGRKLNLEIDWLGYSRKNFNFPGDQAFPHQSFHQELEYLYSHRSLCERLDGNGYTLGPITADHWFVFVADHTIRSAVDLSTDRVLNIMMFDIDENVAKVFYYDQYDQQRPNESKEETETRISTAQTEQSGIKALCPGALIDARAFEPCGYSMNAILFRSYSTIHITPEANCSYASFETNQKVSNYKPLISNVIRTFRPQRFVMTLMADEGGLKSLDCNPVDLQVANYKRTSLASIKVEDDCVCEMGSWIVTRDHRPTRARGATISS